MAVPIRRRNAAPAADEYAPPAAGRAVSRRATPPPEPVEVPKYTDEMLDQAVDDGTLGQLADDENLPTSLTTESEILEALGKIMVVETPPEPEPEVERSPRRGRGERPAVRRGAAAREADDDEPSSRGSQRAAKKGFDAFERENKKSSSFKQSWKMPSNDTALVKFLDDGPYDTYGEHAFWEEIKTGQRTFVCVADERECPLCGIGAKIRAMAMFNIAVIDSGTGEASVEILEAGPKLTKILKRKGEDRTGPLSNYYYSVSSTDPKDPGPVDYMVDVVRSRDVETDWGVAPLSQAEIDELRATAEKENKPARYPSQEALDAAVDKLSQG